MVAACDPHESCLTIRHIDWFDGQATITVTDYRDRGDLPDVIAHLVEPPTVQGVPPYTALVPVQAAPGGYRYYWDLGFDPEEKGIRFDLLLRDAHMTVVSVPVLVTDRLHVIADLQNQEWCGW